MGAGVVYVHRSFTKGRLKCPKTEASRRAVPLQTIALQAIECQESSRSSVLVFAAERSGYIDLHNFRNRDHLARDGREHAIRLLDELSAGEHPRWTPVDAGWTPKAAAAASGDNGGSA